MFVKQISVFLENKSGRLAEVTRILGANNIDISAVSIADTTDFGILRLIVNNPESAEKILKDSGFTVSCTNVLAIAIDDVPGSLSTSLSVIQAEDIGIEYMYAFVGKTSDKALVILKVTELKRAAGILADNKVKVLSSEEVYSL